MKGYKEVDATRLLQRVRPELNSVHRASLLVPQIGNVQTEIAFLNHFLIKRNYSHVGCRITGIDRSGKRIEAHLHPIRDRRVYRFALSEMFADAGAYQIEFFAAENLFIPFPAVMVTHHGPDFINTVHAFNRVLNDVFEDDEFTRVEVAETGIEVTVSDEIDTVVWLMGGMSAPHGDVEVTLDTPEQSLSARMPMDLPRYGVQQISVAQTFGGLPGVKNGLLRVQQPHQPMFYGRLLGARMVRKSGAFSGNHSYYDTRDIDEVWPNAKPSSQIFAYAPELEPRIRMYPEFPKGRGIALTLTLFAHDGNVLRTLPAVDLRNPGPAVEFDIAAILAQQGIDGGDVGSFELQAAPLSGNTLARIAYHLVYGKRGLEGSSIIALGNPNVVPRDPSKGRTWGQAVVGKDFQTWLIVAPGQRSETATHCKLEFYDERGPLAERLVEIGPNGGWVMDVGRELNAELEGAMEGQHHVAVWFYLDADRSDINAHAVTSHRLSGHTTVEHTF